MSERVEHQKARRKAAGKSRGKRRGRKPLDGVQSYALVPAKLQLEHPDPIKQKALSAFLKHGTVVAGCSAAAIGRTTWYHWLKEDELFARLAGEADEHVTDRLEAEGQKRAISGSDTLLIFLLKSRRRAKYGDRQIITTISPEVQMALQQTLQLIASRPTWDSEELLTMMQPFWK